MSEQATAQYKRIIPCLDIRDGRVVKGVKFVDIRDAGDPVETALRYQQQGADELTLLDISATAENRDTMLQMVEQVSRAIDIPLTIGGGIRTLEDIRRVLEAGAARVGISSAAVAHPELIRDAAAAFGSYAVVVAVDAKNVRAAGEPPAWEVFTHGGSRPAGIDAIEWVQRMADYGAGELLLTSIDRDGTRQGFDLQMTRAVADAVPIPVIASGGVGSLQHLVDGIIEGHADAVLAASIFHFGEFTIAEAKQAMAAAGIRVRL